MRMHHKRTPRAAYPPFPPPPPEAVSSHPGRGCLDADPEAFFPRPNDRDKVEIAKAMCDLCPVLAACRGYALGAGPRLFGIWGGMTHSERRIWHHKQRHGDDTKLEAAA